MVVTYIIAGVQYQHRTHPPYEVGMAGTVSRCRRHFMKHLSLSVFFVANQENPVDAFTFPVTLRSRQPGVQRRAQRTPPE
ncbi:hypothetical protein [Klebsiella variicola]|uniref:hypothetical protein n=1 Tax=Klebsiella variicola TaxID=244366 RepID=UPI001E39206A|nr:hypothetical protein [Klebsiella variicola]UHD24395.1 hypothetical protein LUX40_15055 [Klebsiella variicola subsp. variicola]